jgi:cell division septal protein FtsQ
VKIIRTILLLLTLALLVGIVVLLPKQIKIENVSCSSQYGPCNEDISKYLDSQKGKSIIDAEKDINNYLEKQSLVDNYSIQFKLPSIFAVNIVEKKPQFSLLDVTSNKFYLIDKDGQIIKITDKNNLPVVKISGFNGNITEKVNDKYLFALDITYRLFSTYQIKETEMINDSLIAMTNGIKVIFPLEGDKDVLLGGLTMIMSRLNESVKESKINISQIDLRFKNPVLK